MWRVIYLISYFIDDSLGYFINMLIDHYLIILNWIRFDVTFAPQLQFYLFDLYFTSLNKLLLIYVKLFNKWKKIQHTKNNNIVISG